MVFCKELGEGLALGDEVGGLGYGAEGLELDDVFKVVRVELDTAFPHLLPVATSIHGPSESSD